MLCLSIAPRSMAEARRNLHAVPRAADLVELRVDGIRDLDMERLLAPPRPPVIVTNRRRAEGGLFGGSARESFRILRRAIESGADYVDVEASWGTEFVRGVRELAGRTPVICSYHDFRGTPTNIFTVYRRLRSTGAEIIKIVTMARSIGDNRRLFTLLGAARRQRQKLIAFCMGDEGEMSRILTGTFGGWLTFAAASDRQSTAPGQRSLDEMAHVFRACSLGPRTRIFGLVGNPVRQSSGFLHHNRVFRSHRVDAVYLNFLVDDIESFLRAYGDLVTGLSVTMPFKRSVIASCGRLEGDAARLGIVNTVVRRNGTFVGTNTDLPAAIALLRRAGDLRGKVAAILGTGGTARTMAYAALTLGTAALVLGRDAAKAEAVAEELPCGWGTLEDLDSVKPDIIMNATPVGMTVPGSLVSRSLLRKGTIVFDAVNAPRPTRLIRDASAAGCRCITGREFFRAQAVIQSGIFLQAMGQ